MLPAGGSSVPPHLGTCKGTEVRGSLASGSLRGTLGELNEILPAFGGSTQILSPLAIPLDVKPSCCCGLAAYLGLVLLPGSGNFVLSHLTNGE